MTTITISATITSSVIKGGSSIQSPINTIVPTISGSTSIGSVLSCNTGTWIGTSPITYTYQWYRGVSIISGATLSTYTLVTADGGNNISCQVTATNIAGSTNISSNSLSIPLLLDSYPNAAVAYSVRKLRTAYSGAALRVRRSSDNAETDIGFISNQLDTASLLSFVGAGNGFVTTWYDQSLNGNNGVQTTAVQQPRIVNSGVLEVSSVNKPVVRLIDSLTTSIGSYLQIGLWHSNNTQYVGTFSTYQLNNNGNFPILLGSNPLDRGLFLQHDSTLRKLRIATFRIGGSSFIAGTSVLNINQLYLRYDTANRINVQSYINGNSIPDINIADNNSNFNMPTNYWLGQKNSNLNQLDISISEFIAYTTDQTSNKSGIETNINSYYSVWASGPTWDGSQSGMLNTYSGAAVAYSVRALNSAYTGPLIRVRRSSDNTEIDIFALYNGELDTTFLLNFVGAGNGFVTTWYDQSGNSRNATNTTAANQPQIVSSGSLLQINSKPALTFDGTNDSFNITSFAYNTTSYHSFVGKRDLSGRRLFALGGLANHYLLSLWTDNFYYLQANTTGYQKSTGTDTSTNQLLITGLRNISGMEIYKNNTVIPSSFQTITIGGSISTIGLWGTQYLFGSLQEIIYYNTDQSTNRTLINTNINSYFNIYP